MSEAAKEANLAQPPTAINMANTVEPKDSSLSDAKPPKEEENEAEDKEKSGSAKDYFVRQNHPGMY